MTSALEDKIRPAAIAVEKQVKCICISNARVEVKYMCVSELTDVMEILRIRNVGIIGM